MASPSQTVTPPRLSIWEALLSPARAVEVRAWMRQPANRQAALEARGPRGETMLHWAALSDLGLMLDLVGAGLNPNALDADGRGPTDWQFERLWVTHREGVGGLSALNLRKLRLQTDDLASALWRQGGRPQHPALQVGPLAVRCGLWQTLSAWRDLDCDAWTGWDSGAAIHAWPWAPAEQGRRDFLRHWQADGHALDMPDPDGRTALWWAVEARLQAEGKAQQDTQAAIDELIAAGANPQKADKNGVTPTLLPLLRHADEPLAAAIATALQSAPAPGLSVR